MTAGTQFTKKYVLWFVLALAGGLRLWHITWGLPELFEEAFPVAISWKFWNWGNPGFDFDPHFFHYPALTFYLNFIIQAIYFLIGYVSGVFADLSAFHLAYEADPTMVVLLARTLTVLFDVGTVFVVYRLGTEIISEPAGLFAGFIAAVMPLLIRQSHLVNVDTPLTFFSVLSLLFFYRVSMTRALKWYIFSGVSIGLAASSKYNGALLLLILTVTHFYSRLMTAKSKALKSHAPLAYAFLLSGIVFLCFNPYTILSFDEFYNDFKFEEMHMEAGHLGTDPSESTWEFYFLRSIPENVGWSILVVSVLSILYALVRNKKLFVVLALFPVLYLTVICTWNMRADRYVLPAIPPLILLTSYGVMTVWKMMSGQKSAGISNRLFTAGPGRILIISAVGILLCAQQVAAVITYHRSIALPDTRAVAKNWIIRNLPRGSIIGTIQLGIDIPDTSLRVFPMPFLSVNAEKVAAFYDARWFEDFDVMVGSSYDHDRYALDPVRYRDFLSYYDSLRTRWKLITEFVPKENQPGPSIWLFQPYPVPRDKPFPSDLLDRLQSAPESSRVSLFLTNMAKAVYTKGNFVKTEQLLQEILSVEIRNMEARFSLINLRANQGRFGDALETVRAYLRFDPAHPTMLWLQGSLLVKMNNHAEAEPSLQEALRLDNRLSSAYDELLFIYVQRRDKQRAIDILSRHLAILPAGSEKARLVAADLNRLKTIP